VITSLFLVAPISVIQPEHIALPAPKTKKYWSFWLCYCSVTLVLLLLLLLISDLQHGSICPVIWQWVAFGFAAAKPKKLMVGFWFVLAAARACFLLPRGMELKPSQISGQICP